MLIRKSKYLRDQKEDERRRKRQQTIEVRFAYLPKRMENGSVVWLEKYWVLRTPSGEGLRIREVDVLKDRLWFSERYRLYKFSDGRTCKEVLGG